MANSRLTSEPAPAWRRNSDVLRFLGVGVFFTWCLAAAWRLRRAALARRQLQALLGSAVGEEARVVITGATSGIGKELAAEFQRHPGVSLLLGSCGEQRADRGRCRIVPLDLLDLNSVQRFAKESHDFLQQGGRGLRLLINNAGLKQEAGGRTKVGISPVWQVNFLGPFLLTEILARRRESAEVGQPLCVVHVASGRENESLLDQDMLEAAAQGTPTATEYADSKRALLLWTSVRAQSLAFRGNLFAHAANPGRVDTRLGAYWVPEWLWHLSKPYRMLRYRSVSEGALAVAAPGLVKQALGRFGKYSSGETLLEDLVIWRMPDKQLSVQLVRWASQVTALEARSFGRPLSETGRPLTVTDLQAMSPVGKDVWSTEERRLHNGVTRYT